MSYYYYNWQKSNIVEVDDGPLFAGSVAIVVMRMSEAPRVFICIPTTDYCTTKCDWITKS